jgi:hypothetical protein
MECVPGNTEILSEGRRPTVRREGSHVETSHENVETSSKNAEKPAAYVETPDKFSTFFANGTTLQRTKAETSETKAEKLQE